jgi:hypothetical protein
LTKSVAKRARTATDDPDLAVIIKVWPTLSEPIRRAIKALVEVKR